MTPVSPIPITIGGASSAALGRAARIDGWDAPEVSLEDAVRMREKLIRLREEVGHDDPGARARDRFRIYVKSPSIEADVLQRYQEAEFEDVVVPFCALYAAEETISPERPLAALDELAERIMIPELVAST
jgi:hypothetical protein